ncbi:hypothetical protein [Sinorhizobium meliloti]|uniref:hypothetical protein n=1 Tax=Rhizobium meliloti TaxID=382 RepID=UPI0012951878|nr:hypothetical protein [Sinorhizobium meliloti]MDW9491679.1 hypothetical protein [Sinorhizobium meliloti]MDW9531882.1 hypothetical protein [Sinorhizobium meliloti]MDX0267620.1 hypothetical protein [Sinorhizobium meliloti]MQV02945.1 hypothetical protein [Sinorhizobium meliloti]
MALKLGVAAAIAAADAVVDRIDLGASASTIVIYDGTEPATPATAIGAQVALVTFNLPDPAFGAAVDTVGGGQATANPVTSVAAAASGTASWFRIINGDGTVELQGSVTDTGGNGDLKVSSTSIVAGIEVSVISLTYTQPKS